MTIRTAHLTALVFVALATAPVLAQPTVRVAADVPFTGDDLVRALELRVTSPDVRAEVERRGDVVVVTVGDREDTVAITEGRHDLARTVAMVVVSLAEPATSAAAPAPIVEPPSASPLSLRAAIGYQRTDGGVYTTPFLASVLVRLSPSTRLVASLGVGEHGTMDDTKTAGLGRVGVEGRFASLGVEIGGTAKAWRHCSGGRATGAGAYGIARIYVPLPSERLQLLVEAGGYYLLADIDDCISILFPGASATDEYAGHIGLGVEWKL